LPEAVGPVRITALIGYESIVYLLIKKLGGGERDYLAVILLHFGSLEHGQLKSPPINGNRQLVGIRIVIYQLV